MSVLPRPSANIAAASSLTRSRNACLSAVRPPPCGYLIHPAYRDDHRPSAPTTTHLQSQQSAVCQCLRHRRHHLFDHLDWGLKSYRGRRPGASLRGQEEGNGAPQPGSRTLPRRPDQQDHLACDGTGRPLAFIVTGGNTNDCTQFTAVMKAIRVPAPARDGPAHSPRTSWRQGLQLQSYPHLAASAWYQSRHSRASRPGPQPAEPRQPWWTAPAFDRDTYKRCNVVERCFNKLKQWRGIATGPKPASGTRVRRTRASILRRP